ncbi:MAG: B12-binding domain-containing radical SAM protein [Candidatus Omnitrophota bacterium]
MEQKKIQTDILLINPPFAMPDKPCLSIPVLAGYLKDKGFRVQGLDLNIEFYRDFLSKKSLLKDLEWVRERLAKLKKQSAHSPQNDAERTRLGNVLAAAESAGDRLFQLFEESKSLGRNNPNERPDHWKAAYIPVALQLASAPYFPESIFFTLNTGYVRYKPNGSHFSSKDIIDNLQKKTLVSESFNRLIKEFFEDISPRIVGISVSFPDMIMPAFTCAKIIKSLVPDVHVTMGGAFISVHMREIRNTDLFHVVDSFILDEGEIPLELLIKEIAGGHPNQDKVPGIMYFSGEKGEIIRVPTAPPPSMATLPPPDYSVFDLDQYLLKRNSMTLLSRLSRGCYWAKCTFCRTGLPFIHNYNQSTAEHLYSQLENLVEQTGIRRFDFTDDAASPELLEHLCQKIIDEKLLIHWGTNFRLDKRLTLERLMRFNQAGCVAASLGLEAFNDRILKLMKKGVTEDLVEHVLSNFHWACIDVSIYMIVGFPTETEEEALASFEKIMRLKEKELIRYCVYNVFEFVPYSEIADSPENFGIRTIPEQKDRDLSPPISRFESTGMSREKALELCHLFIKRFNA